MADKRTIYLVDDEEAIRRSVGFMLRNNGFTVQAYASGAEFLAITQTLCPGCILLDIRMPGMDGLEVQHSLNDRGIALPVIMLTGHGDVTLAVRAIKGGAVEFLEKPFEQSALLDAIEAAFLRLASADRTSVTAADAVQRLAALTPRERDVLNGMVRGQPNKITALELGISRRTVEVHRANMMAKLHVRSLSDLLRVAFAAERGSSLNQPAAGAPR